MYHRRHRSRTPPLSTVIATCSLIGLSVLFGLPMLIGLLDRWINYWGLK